MPTYEYQCLKCEKTFELFQSMKDEPIRSCPEGQCGMSPWGKGDVKRLLGTGAGIIFKGSGFYSTDYRSEGYKTAASKDSSASGSGSGDSGSGAKTETKPAADSPKPAPKTE